MFMRAHRTPNVTPMSSAVASARTHPGAPLRSRRTRAAHVVRERGEIDEVRARRLLNALLRSLSLRDRATARHSAAVARYASELAVATGASPAQQRLVHTAGLLHDIGKFILPDSILQTKRGLSAKEWELVKRHPAASADIVSPLPGYGQVARAILHHHERIDGSGYPDNLRGNEIPWISRVISVADAYDAMTGRDSYSRLRSVDDAVTELQRVAGTQLDARLVEGFIDVVGTRGVGFRHADDSDFEAELAVEHSFAAC
jgi:putative nucleotidyltransferase with HDIG domain